MILDKVPSIVRDQRLKDFKLFGLDFRPTDRVDHIQYSSKLKNFNLVLKYDKLTLTNSIHVFKMENNAGDFTYSNLLESIKELDCILEGNFRNGKLIRIATGVNLSDVCMDSLYMYKTNYFRDMVSHKSNQVYGKKVKFSQYSFKIYDKKFEQLEHYKNKCPKGLFRMEKEVRSLQHFKNRVDPIFIHRVGDLMSKDLLGELIRDFLDGLNNIQMTEKINLEGLKTNHLKDIAVMENPIMREHLKKNNNESYRKIRRNYESLKQKHQSNNSIEKLRTKARDQFSHLIGS